MNEEMVSKVVNHNVSDLPEMYKLALDLAEGWLTEYGHVDEQLIEDLKRHYTEPQIFEICIFVGTLETSHKLQNVFDMDAVVPEGETYSFDGIKTPSEMRHHFESLNLVETAIRE